MCGRFSFATSPKKIKETLGADIQFEAALLSSYNIAPTQYSYVVTNEQPNLLQAFKWGLIPYWAKDAKNAAKLINARMEGIEDKVSFKTPIRERRCLVLVDSFYEWKRVGKQKDAYRILMKDESLMVMAGVWDIWNNGGELVKTFSIITAPPNNEMSSIHTRMPVILSTKEARHKWLKNRPLAAILKSLKTPEDDILQVYRVSNKVNSVANNSPDLHQEIPETLTLFD